MEILIKNEFNSFLQSNMPEVSLSQLDEIALDYIVSVLQQLGEDESFDMEEFLEVMTAYIPDLEEVNRENLCSWMFDLASKIAHVKTEGTPDTPKEKFVDDNQESPETTNSEHVSHIDNIREQDPSSSCDTVETTESSQKFDSSFLDKVAALSDIFPDACSLEVEQCLLVTNGDAEETARLMLLKRTEHADGNHLNTADSRPKARRRSSQRQDCALSEQMTAKDVILSRYGFVDVEADEKNHQPTLPKEAPKKLVRYRDNQVVSTRGEKFSLTKRDETDEMKKTYINLKPARKYRFH